MMFHNRVLALLALLCAAPLLPAATPASAPAGVVTPAPAVAAGDPRVAIAAKMEGVKAEDLHATPVPGLYELLRAGDAAYVSTDGKYAIIGDMYETGSNKDLTENRRRDLPGAEFSYVRPREWRSPSWSPFSTW